MSNVPGQERRVRLERVIRRKQAAVSRRILEASQLAEFPYEIKTFGLTIQVYPGVFSPRHFRGWEGFTTTLPPMSGQRVLEIGCGCGVTALYLATRGASHVTAVDINPAAVENTTGNAKLNKITNIDVRVSDVFSAIRSDERFDTIYWNFPFIWQPSDYVYRSILERALFDPGYRLLDQFLRDANAFLLDGGSVFLGMGDFAELGRFDEIRKRHGWWSSLVGQQPSEEGNPVEFLLYALTPKVSL